ncbi:MAG: hypothetical protein KGM16_15690 [Bacteroidota bacterium]|nr:hypothetical protein [Bacteroidota bacterium]
MNRKYTLEWFDSLITVSLNPGRTHLEEILPEQITLLKLKMEEKKMEQQFLFMNEVFSLLEEKKIKLLISQYRTSLIMLLEQAMENYNTISDNKPALKQVTNEVITCVDELLTFIEVRFPVYIGTEEKVAPTLLAQIKKEVKQKTDKLKIELYKKTDAQLAIILLDVLYSFCKCKDNHATFQQVGYIKELLNQLVSLDNHETGNDVFSDLDKMLIYMNFNSEPYIEYLVQKISKKIGSFESINDKIEKLQWYAKEFNQLRRKAETALYTGQTSLRETISNWLVQEIGYLERRRNLPVVPFQVNPGNQNQKTSVEKKKAKLLCIFSTDQMGILLRAIDELQVVKARSMTEVFKTIVPHLSTPYKEDLSYDAVRSKSYAAEERDKKIVMETLQQVIEKVKRY